MECLSHVFSIKSVGYMTCHFGFGRDSFVDMGRAPWQDLVLIRDRRYQSIKQYWMTFTLKRILLSFYQVNIHHKMNPTSRIMSSLGRSKNVVECVRVYQIWNYPRFPYVYHTIVRNLTISKSQTSRILIPEHTDSAHEISINRGNRIWCHSLLGKGCMALWEQIYTAT